MYSVPALLPIPFHPVIYAVTRHETSQSLVILFFPGSAALLPISTPHPTLRYFAFIELAMFSHAMSLSSLVPLESLYHADLPVFSRRNHVIELTESLVNSILKTVLPCLSRVCSALKSFKTREIFKFSNENI